MITIVLGIRAVVLVFILGSAFSFNPERVFTRSDYDNSDDSDEPPFPPLAYPVCTQCETLRRFPKWQDLYIYY